MMIYYLHVHSRPSSETSHDHSHLHSADGILATISSIMKSLLNLTNVFAKVSVFNPTHFWLLEREAMQTTSPGMVLSVLVSQNLVSEISNYTNHIHPPLHSPQKKNQKTVSGDPKNYHLGCLGYPKQHQTKSFECKILIKVIFLAKIKHFSAYINTWKV